MSPSEPFGLIRKTPVGRAISSVTTNIFEIGIFNLLVKIYSFTT